MHYKLVRLVFKVANGLITLSKSTPRATLLSTLTTLRSVSRDCPMVERK